jgi:hypothetical protein
LHFLFFLGDGTLLITLRKFTNTEGTLLHRSAKSLLNLRSLGLESLAETNIVRVGEDSVFHLHVICSNQTSLLAKTLNSVKNLAAQTLVSQLWVQVAIKDGQHIGVGIGLHALGVLIFLDSTLYNEVTLDEFNAIDKDLLVKQISLHIVAREQRQSLLNLLNVFLELLAQRGKVYL